MKDANNVKRLKIYLTFIVTSTEYAIYQQRRLVNSFFLSISIKILFIFRCNTQKVLHFDFQNVFHIGNFKINEAFCVSISVLLILITQFF